MRRKNTTDSPRQHETTPSDNSTTSQPAREWDYRTNPPPAGRETPPMREELTTTPGRSGKQSRQKEPDPELVRLRAYYKWVDAGRPEGDGTRYWLAAEEELQQRMR